MKVLLIDFAIFTTDILLEFDKLRKSYRTQKNEIKNK